MTPGFDYIRAEMNRLIATAIVNGFNFPLYIFAHTHDRKPIGLTLGDIPSGWRIYDNEDEPALGIASELTHPEYYPVSIKIAELNETIDEHGERIATPKGACICATLYGANRDGEFAVMMAFDAPEPPQ